MPQDYDIIVIGAGLNGLTTAAYLARAGKRVLVLEQRGAIGGAAVTEEPFPGFKFDSVTHNAAGLDPAIVRELDLLRHGLELIPTAVSVFAPGGDGRGLALWREDAATIDSISPFSQSDANKWRAFRERMVKLARVLDTIHALPPPSITTRNPGDLPGLGKLGLQLRGLGKRDMPEFLRSLPMPVADMVEDEFESELLRGVLAAGGIRGLMLGPLGGGTTLNFLRGVSGGAVRATTLVRGGIGMLAEALARAAKSRGAEIRTGTKVVRIRAREGRVTGIVTASGQEINAQVVSSVDPKQTFLKLVEPIELDPTFSASIRHIRTRGAVAKMNLALDGLPSFKGSAPAQLRGTISISPGVSYLERAYDEAKYGGVSKRPYLEIVIPSLVDPSRAPQNKHVMSVWMQYAPYRLGAGDWYAEKAKLGKTILDCLSEYAPDIPSLLLNAQILTPLDLNDIYGLPEGDPNHGQMTLDQFLFMRPVPGISRYRSPLDGLYLTGAGSHPGGIPCAAGRNAAREVLK